MYEISVSVAACVRAGTHADVAWLVADEGFGPRDRGEALVLTPGGGRMGGVLGGALNDQVAALVAEGARGRLVDLTVDEVGALIAGLPSGGTARCLVAAASDFPDGFWDDLFAGRPACLVTHLDGDRVTRIESYGESEVAELGEDIARFFSRGTSDSLVEADRVVTVLWPVPRLAMIGGGPILEAVETAAGPLGWEVHRFRSPAEAAPALLGYGPLDMVLVAAHDLHVAGNALSAALSGNAGYVGALGTPEMNVARLDWLTSRGVPGLERIHGPAGLDLGARRPAEVAIAVIAEALATRSGSVPRSLRDAASEVA